MKVCGELKKDLFSFKSRKIVGFSIFLIILLDIFLFSIVLKGVDVEQSSNVKTSEVFPYQCMTMFNSSTKINYNNLNSMYMMKHIHATSPLVDERCKSLKNKFEDIKNNAQIRSNKTQYDLDQKRIRVVKAKIKNIQSKYNIELLEVIANQKDSPSAIRSRYQSYLSEESEINARLNNLKQIYKYKVYSDYVSYKNKHKEEIKSDKISHLRWYKFKNYLYLLKFILPLFMISLFFYFKNKTKQLKGEDYNNIALIMSSHLLVILMLPVFFGLLSLIFSVIPKIFFTKIIAFLISIKAEFLGFYGLMVIAILVVFSLVYGLQKYNSKKQPGLRINKKYINKSICSNCDSKVNYEKDNYCSVCSNKIQEECGHCKKNRLVAFLYCRHCGQENKIKI